MHACTYNFCKILNQFTAWQLLTCGLNVEVYALRHECMFMYDVYISCLWIDAMQIWAFLRKFNMKT